MNIQRSKQYAVAVVNSMRVWKPPKLVIFCSVVTVIGSVAFFLKEKNSGGKYNGNENIRGKVVIITGATSGIGKETAYELADKGGKIYLACRNMKQCEVLKKNIMSTDDEIEVHCKKLDLSSNESIREFVNEFKKSENKLDILINNAAVYRPPIRKTKDGFEIQMGVNYFGHFLLTNLLLDHLKAASNSRIINVTCKASYFGKINKNDINFDKSYESSEAYKSSKLANVLFTIELANKLVDTNVKVFSVDPGICSSNLMRYMGHDGFMFTLFVFPLLWPFMRSSKRGAQEILFASLSPSLENNTGSHISDMKIETIKHDAASDLNLIKWLWNLSEKWTRLNS